MKKAGLILCTGMMLVLFAGCSSGSGNALNDGRLTNFEIDTSAMDTEAPQVTLKELDPVAAGTELTLEECITEASDSSEYVLKFQKDGKLQDTFTVKEGEQEYTILATDAYNNVQEYTGKVTGVIPDTTPPVITAKDRSFSVGYDLDYMKWVSASDDCDGDLTAAVTVDSSGVDKNKPGTYKAVYIVRDAAGNVGTKEITVTVTPQKEKAQTAQAVPQQPVSDADTSDNSASRSSGGDSGSSSAQPDSSSEETGRQHSGGGNSSGSDSSSSGSSDSQEPAVDSSSEEDSTPGEYWVGGADDPNPPEYLPSAEELENAFHEEFGY